ncbi:SCP2 sterol-binding domain-containing protein [Micromonospora sp. ZYX-F-536]|uniref:SCP2 sterol-binding domain-containing protein n=1 Tax=Micromonospora sp. ZYX-F-536 TaxID=3457629 RepID=UPI0040406F60
MSGNYVNPATMDPREFARMVKTTSTDDLRRMMHGDQRAAVLDELFARMPGVFRADRAGSTNAAIHWQIGDRPDGGVDIYELVIANGTCTLSDSPGSEPKLTLMLGAVDFLNLVTGNAHPVLMVMRGRLKTRGDAALTARFPKLFDIPKA